MFAADDTIVAVATPAGRGGVAMARLSGPAAHDIALVLAGRTRPLRARRVVVRLDDTAVMFHSTNVRVRTRTSVREGR